jgi:hypothetical protein
MLKNYKKNWKERSVAERILKQMWQKSANLAQFRNHLQKNIGNGEGNCYFAFLGNKILAVENKNPLEKINFG